MIFGDDEYIQNLNWLMTLALLSERISPDLTLQVLQCAEKEMVQAGEPIADPASERVEHLKRYLEATARWKEEARRYVVGMRRTEPAAARAREDLRRDAAQHPGAAAGNTALSDEPGRN